MITPIESIQYLIDVFIEGGYAEEEDLDHLDTIHMWLRSEKQARDAAFNLRVFRRDVNPDYPTQEEVDRSQSANHPGVPDRPGVPGWVTESRYYENPATMEVNRGGEDGPLDEDNPPESRATYTIMDTEGNEYYFTPKED